MGMVREYLDGVDVCVLVDLSRNHIADHKVDIEVFYLKLIECFSSLCKKISYFIILYRKINLMDLKQMW